MIKITLEEKSKSKRKSISYSSETNHTLISSRSTAIKTQSFGILTELYQQRKMLEPGRYIMEIGRFKRKSVDTANGQVRLKK